jgi:4-hydroxybenzoyl-CoA thioesterase
MMFSKDYDWRWGDVDLAGMAYYPSFFHYFHQLFEDWWKEGMARPYPDVILGRGIGFPVVSVATSFLSSVHYGDRVRITLGILSVSRSSAAFGYRVRIAERLACKATITTVCIDLGRKKAITIPEDLRTDMARFLVEETLLDQELPR